VVRVTLRVAPETRRSAVPSVCAKPDGNQLGPVIAQWNMEAIGTASAPLHRARARRAWRLSAQINAPSRDTEAPC